MANPQELIYRVETKTLKHISLKPLERKEKKSCHSGIVEWISH